MGIHSFFWRFFRFCRIVEIREPTADENALKKYIRNVN